MPPTKCSEIPDKPILELLAKHQDHWCTWWDYFGENDELSVTTVMPKDTPIKLQLAKMKNLRERGLIGGCTCGCRGDFAITDKGLELIDAKRTHPYNGY